MVFSRLVLMVLTALWIKRANTNDLMIHWYPNLCASAVGDSDPPAWTGDVLIVIHWRLSVLTQHLTWFDKPPTSTGEFHIIRDRKKIQYKYMKKKDHFTQTLLPALIHCCTWQQCCCPWQPLFFFWSLTFCTLSHTTTYL